MTKILCVVGARPNFMKIAPLMDALKGHPRLSGILVHTGQHYDEAMSKSFFDDLRIPKPDLNLDVGSGTHAAQTAHIMETFEPVVTAQRPDLVLVVGDVNSTLACSVTAAKLLVPVAHVEAGLRSFDRTMPEEINRLVTDAVSDLLFTTEQSAAENLLKEGVPAEKIHFVGNVMIDTLVRHLDAAKRSRMLEQLMLTPRGYALVTLHRPSNVDHAEGVREMLAAFRRLAERVPIVFPIHPRTRQRLADFGLEREVSAIPHLTLTEPLGYLDFLQLMRHAALVLTDSGGIQEETTYLGVPCLTLRDNTERPVTVTHGTNRLIGRLNAQRIMAEADRILAGGAGATRIPALWDGHAAQRIVEILDRWAQARAKTTSC